MYWLSLPRSQGVRGSCRRSLTQGLKQSQEDLPFSTSCSYFLPCAGFILRLHWVMSSSSDSNPLGKICFSKDSYRSTGIRSDWTGSGHSPASEPMTRAGGMACSDWLDPGLSHPRPTQTT